MAETEGGTEGGVERGLAELAAEAAIAAVRDLHSPDSSGTYCDHCWTGPLPGAAGHIAESKSRFPCVTLRALDTALVSVAGTNGSEPVYEVTHGVEVQYAAEPGQEWHFRYGWFKADQGPDATEYGIDRARRTLARAQEDPDVSGARLRRQVILTVNERS